VAYMKDYSENKWYFIADAPFPVIDIAGNNATGPAVIGQGSRKVAYMNSYRDNTWKIVTDTPFPVYQIAGTNDSGLVVCGTARETARALSNGASQRIDGKIRGTVLKTSVVEFTERGDLGIQDAGAIIAEWLTTSLNKTGAFEVYERLSLSTLMEEHKLGMTGLLDDETIAEIGRIRGVEAIVTGSVIKFGDIISVTAKVIDVETAKIIKSSDIKATNVNEISSGIDGLARELARE
ncbi:CsgG/HfaB family protein, partial [bacterium]|nr:CsgG/HfaB family protein [bacterium]